MTEADFVDAHRCGAEGGMMLICKKTMRELNESAAQAPDTDGGASTIGARTPVAADPVAYFASREWGGGIIWEQMQKAYKDAPEVIPLYRHPDPRIAALERDLAAAQAEVTACASQLERDRFTIAQQAQIIVDLKADLAAANTRADAMLRVAEKHEAEAAALLKACRKAVLALAHASTENPLYNEDYEALSAAIEAAKESGNG
jgi:hypothetical protein